MIIYLYKLILLIYVLIYSSNSIEAPLGGVPPPIVFGAWSFVMRQKVKQKEPLISNVSCIRLHGLVFGFVFGKFFDFLGKLAEDLAKNDGYQFKSGKLSLLSNSRRTHAQSKAGSLENLRKMH